NSAWTVSIQGTEGVQEVKGDPLYAGRVPRQVYEEM
ncbi:hypothetical protein V3C99_001805, partial [Haemonchus contortus]